MHVAQRRNRSQEGIVVEILEAARPGARQTRIMYRASLSYEQVKKYLSRLVESGMLVEDPERKVFVTTDLGSQFIMAYQEFKRVEKSYRGTKDALSTLLRTTGIPSIH